MALATALNTFGGQFQNLHTVIVLLSFGTKLSKATRFDSNNLIDFGKIGYHWKKSVEKNNIQYFQYFSYYHIQNAKKSDKVTIARSIGA